MSRAQAEQDDRGAEVAGPPWILGYRGSPLEAPENTLASLRRALALGLDGVAYDVRACRSGELVLLADATLDRTTNARGLLADKTLVGIASADAGGWFDARFKGERLALLGEALELRHERLPEQCEPRHLILVEERGVALEIARAASELGSPLAVRVASTVRDVCLEARDAGLESMLVARQPSERDREFVREHAIAAYAQSPAQWRGDANDSEWPCERWSLRVDDPAELYDACRMPLNGFATTEPLRASAVRALVRAAPADGGPYPLAAPDLEVLPGAWTHGRGDWCGSWAGAARVRNPFPFRVRAAIGLIPRHGAFEIESLPVALELDAGERATVPFKLTGGSWRPGGDPLLFAHFHWRGGPGRRAGRLLLDVPLKRVRTVVADVIAVRLPMLRESPADAPASMTLRRHREHLLVSIESSGGWKDARTIVHLDGRFHYGGRGVRVALPPDFDRREQGVAFGCGMQAEVDGEWRVRRWCGGVPDDLRSGSPGRLLPLRSA
jgi:hypothetical protein